jgi:hypothetical protein
MGSAWTMTEEQVVWRSTINKGIFRKHLQFILEITTSGIRMIDERPAEHGDAPLVSFIPYSEVSNVVVTSEHNTGMGYHYTIRLGGIHNNASYYGVSSWNGVQRGDIEILDKSGVARMIWYNMESPNNIVRLIKAEMHK